MNNPQAFPGRRPLKDDYYFEGMTLRDYFAAAALTGICSNTKIIYTPSEAIKEAFVYADFMLKERDK